jgi:hypothetical protein
MPEITIPSFVITGLQVIIAFIGAFLVALWISMIVWTFRDARRRSRDVFAILLAALMVVIFGPLGLLLYFLLRPPVTLDELYERSLEEEALLQDLEERPRCPGCSRQVKEDWILCPDCHTTLQNVCANCQHHLHLNWTICPFCATPVEAPAAHDHIEHAPSAPSLMATRPMAAPERAILPEEEVIEAVEVEDYSPPSRVSRPAYGPASAPTIGQAPIAMPSSTKADETRPYSTEADSI